MHQNQNILQGEVDLESMKQKLLEEIAMLGWATKSHKVLLVDDRIGKTAGRPELAPDDEHLHNFLARQHNAHQHHQPSIAPSNLRKLPTRTTHITSSKWSSSKKSWTRSSSASKTVLMTKTTGTRIPVHTHLTTSSTLQIPSNSLSQTLNQRHTNTRHPESDTSSIASSPTDETLYERILALQDMIPASTRRSISSKVSTTSSWIKSGLFMGGKTLWVVSTSALLLGVPWALAYSEEQMIVEQERAELMAQRAQNEFMAPGTPTPGQPQGAKPAL
jgi:import receptor subunit TOM22